MTTASRTPEKQAELEALAALAPREHGAGRLAEAAEAYRKILLLRPGYAEAHNNLGIILAEQGQSDEALAQFEQALTLRPDYAEVHNNLGTVLMNQGKLDEAAARYQQAVALRPDYAQAHFNLGNARFKQDQFDQAAASYRQALTLQPDYAEAHCNLGNTLWRQRKLDEAVAHHEQALALRPNYAEAHLNLGNVLWVQGKLHEAAASYEKAWAFRPAYPEAHYGLGNALWLQARFDEAEVRYQQALALRPDYAEAHWGLAACHLVQGDYERGWPEYEGRPSATGLELTPCPPRWTGQPLTGRSLLLLAEQGIGDTLHFIRYARLLKERGPRVVLAAPPALAGLLASHPDVDELLIVGSSATLPRCDFYLPLPSAPGAFLTDAQAIPHEVPYLWADPDLADKWRAELAAMDGFKIGIAWQGTRDFGFDPWRSIPLADFAPLAALPGVRLLSLQKGAGSEQIGTVDFPVLDLASRLDHAAGPFMDTAAVIQGLDLVVTADTAIGHLAGALGAPVWLALQFSPDWRWLRDRDDSPWYPTMRLFRQTTFGRWPDVFDRMAQAVENLPSRAAPPAQSVSPPAQPDFPPAQLESPPARCDPPPPRCDPPPPRIVSPPADLDFLD